MFILKKNFSDLCFKKHKSLITPTGCFALYLNKRPHESCRAKQSVGVIKFFFAFRNKDLKSFLCFAMIAFR